MLITDYYDTSEWDVMSREVRLESREELDIAIGVFGRVFRKEEDERD